MTEKSRRFTFTGEGQIDDEEEEEKRTPGRPSAWWAEHKNDVADATDRSGHLRRRCPRSTSGHPRRRADRAPRGHHGESHLLLVRTSVRSRLARERPRPEAPPRGEWT